MAVIDRASSPPQRDEAPSRAAVPDRPTADLRGCSWPGRVLLASLSAAAGAIHLAMTPSHAGAWLPEGIAFLLAAWVQLGVAALLLVRPSRAVLVASCVANAAFVGAWGVTRLWGSPFGPESGVAHAASFVDGATVLLELLLVVGGVVLLVRPASGSGLGSGARRALVLVPVGALLLASAAIASPGASDHAHGGSGELAAGHGHDGAGDDHDHGAPVDDKGLSLIMNGAGEGGGHVHDSTVAELDPATQAELDAQLAAMEPFMERFPTVADAEAAGYRRQGPYAPALGAHYAESGIGHVNPGPTMTEEALQHPMLIYSGVEPEAVLVGFMYNIFSLDTENPPEGFAGPNDHWHFHTDVCLTIGPDGSTDAPLGADAAATEELCDRYGGILIENTGYMVHVWPVPGWESPQGLFGNLNAKLTCPDGTYYTVAQEEIGSRTNVCADVPA